MEVFKFFIFILFAIGFVIFKIIGKRFESAGSPQTRRKTIILGHDEAFPNMQPLYAEKPQQKKNPKKKKSKYQSIAVQQEGERLTANMTAAKGSATDSQHEKISLHTHYDARKAFIYSEIWQRKY